MTALEAKVLKEQISAIRREVVFSLHELRETRIIAQQMLELAGRQEQRIAQLEIQYQQLESDRRTIYGRLAELASTLELPPSISPPSIWQSMKEDS